ncbi:MAG: hypothetical protein M3Z64_10635, partial [Verrucomicrobiota bacterium]|nr:hypothetical protein [Verrucomicrobiota bacterium]
MSLQDRALDDLCDFEPCDFGQIRIATCGKGSYLLTHCEDAGRADLVPYDDPGAAEKIARYDDAGKYRPLKTAPNLRHGWRLNLARRAALRLALDLFYPGRLACYDVWKCGDLRTTSLRQTLARQTGMYRVAAKITDEQVDALVGRFCRSDGGCLRTI